jgi:hypothetical protein
MLDRRMAAWPLIVMAAAAHFFGIFALHTCTHEVGDDDATQVTGRDGCEEEKEIYRYQVACCRKY